MNPTQMISRGRQVLLLERDVIAAAADRLGDSFAAAVQLLHASAGRVIVSGVGKSGLIGRKIAATLTSTGTPATFLHPTESVHGDLGIVGAQDVAILLSKSGETVELLPLMEQLVRLGVPTIAITGQVDSTLGRHAQVVLDAAVREEACPHDLAPTTSTTLALALGDALAVVLLEAKGFRREDFARFHPGGALGRRLLLRVRDVMVQDDLPILPRSATMREAVVELAKRRGICVIADASRELLGVITTGDLSRLMESGREIFSIPVTEVMHQTPKVIDADALASAAVHLMETKGVVAVPVLDAARRMVGVVHLHDLLRAGAA
ncbi:MAG: KpsF/GutQ family sugar-phosphate isomerase [Gemmatimonadaceae bacterium]